MILGKIPYLNTTPYFHFLSERWLKQHVVVNAPPAQLGELARQGNLDAAPFSFVDAAQLVGSGDFEYLGDMGIAAKGPIQSILLFGIKSPKTLEGKSIAVTSHTATTVRLMEVWLREKIMLKQWNKVSMGQSASATLLIGDDALSRLLKGLPGDPAPIDLCEEWSSWTGLPFVFARWAVRKNLPDAQKRELQLSIWSAMELALDDLEAVAERASEDTAFEAPFIESYLRGITYKMGPEELKGSELFLNKLAALTER
jgi:chorismate dehydratase